MKKLFFILLILFSVVLPGFTQPITSTEIDQLVERTMKTFQVPGMAVAIVKDGKVIHSKGYGISSMKTGQKVDENTLFGIASNSKAFTAATLAILVDAKKLSWNDKVIKYIPEFRMYNSYVTEDFTIKDIIYNLRFLKQTSPFRTKFDYDNLLYMVAGEVVTRVSGTIWEQFVEEQILKPLAMSRSAASYGRLKDKSNVIDGHAMADNKLQAINRHSMAIGHCAAGGIYSSIADMSKWMIAQLDKGKYGGQHEKQLFSESAQNEMWSPQTNVPVRVDKYNSHFSAYGLGWFLTDVKGTKQVSHTGGLEGMVTQVTLFPELELGIVVLTNQEVGAAFSSVTNTIKDSYLGLPPEDWVLHYDTIIAKNLKESDELTTKIQDEINKGLKSGNSGIDPAIYEGQFQDDWLGKVKIDQVKGKLWFHAKRSPQMRGEMSFYKGNTFVVKWANRSMNADAFVVFNLDAEGKAVGFQMRAISPLTDFSYDFQDLNFTRSEK